MKTMQQVYDAVIKGRRTRRGPVRHVHARGQWQVPGAAEQQYYTELIALLRKVFGPGLGHLVSVDDLDANEYLDAHADRLASTMVLGRLSATTRTWRSAARENMKGGTVYEALQSELNAPTSSIGIRTRQLIQSNALLIRSLPRDVASSVAAAIANQARAGERATASIPSLITHVARARARLIARTETSKATTALTEARAEDLGLDWYVWRSSRDQRTRLSHKRMGGVLVRWAHPPSPERLLGERSTLGHYAAGAAPNCRCYPEPLLRLAQVEWPHRVYYGGTVRPMTLAAFRRLNHLSKSDIDLGVTVETAA